MKYVIVQKYFKKACRKLREQHPDMPESEMKQECVNMWKGKMHMAPYKHFKSHVLDHEQI